MYMRHDKRIFAAVEFTDATTGRLIENPVRVNCQELGIVQNLSGQYVVCSATHKDPQIRANLKSYGRSFEVPPTDLGVESVTYDVEVADDSGVFLPRVFQLSLPRSSVDSGSGSDNWADLFKPVSINLFRSPNSSSLGNWSGVRLSLQVDQNGSKTPLSGALVEVSNAADDTIAATGVSDQRGEVFVPVTGIPVTTFLADTSPPAPPTGGGTPPTAPTPPEGIATGNEVGKPQKSFKFKITASTDGIGNPRKRIWPVDPERLGSNAANWINENDSALPDINLRTGEMVHHHLTLKPGA